MSFFYALLVFCLHLTKIQCKCATTFITTCEKTSDVPRYGDETWTNLIIANDPCSKTNPGPPDEVLKERAFDKTSNLEELYISERLTEIAPRAFDGLERLTYLKLHKNAIKVIPRAAFSNLPGVFKMDLQDNFIENIQHGLFENASVASINLSHNKINNIQVDQLNLPSLTRLTITNNDIVGLAPGCFHQNLEHLNLDRNSIVEMDQRVLSNLQNLKELILSNNKLNGIAITFKLRSLETLDLTHNEITGIQDGSFNGFKELKTLLLGHNRIRFLSHSIFPIGNVVSVLHLHRNRLMLLHQHVGEKLVDLKEITLSGNPWACPCLFTIGAYVKENNIHQPQCDMNYFTTGQFAICTVSESSCTGAESLDEDTLKRFEDQLQYDFCER